MARHQDQRSALEDPAGAVDFVDRDFDAGLDRIIGGAGPVAEFGVETDPDRRPVRLGGECQLAQCDR